MKARHIHIDWDGPFSIDDLPDLNDEDIDYGVYQIYGGHPVYGSSVLLYIGKAVEQTFATRIKQEEWEFNCDSGNVEIYVGRLTGSKTPKDWDDEIALAESLLIYSHKPALNSQNVKSAPDPKLRKVHVFNWVAFRDLMSEVSGIRWKPDDELDDYVYYGTHIKKTS